MAALTRAFLHRYMEAYTNANLTTWVDDFHQVVPKNRLADTLVVWCCGFIQLILWLAFLAPRHGSQTRRQRVHVPCCMLYVEPYIEFLSTVSPFPFLIPTSHPCSASFPLHFGLLDHRPGRVSPLSDLYSHFMLLVSRLVTVSPWQHGSCPSSFP